VDAQRRSGLSPQAAFETAVQRIGKAEALKAEFEKTPPAGLSRRYLCMFCFCAAPLLVFVNFWALQPGEISPLARLGGLATMLLVVVYISGLPFFYKRLPNPRNRLVQTAMWLGCILAIVWPLVGTFSALGVIHLNPGIVLDMMIWSVGAGWFATWLAYGVSGEAGNYAIAD
jgi:hypothetical protein